MLVIEILNLFFVCYGFIGQRTTPGLATLLNGILEGWQRVVWPMNSWFQLFQADGRGSGIAQNPWIAVVNKVLCGEVLVL